MPRLLRHRHRSAAAFRRRVNYPRSCTSASHDRHSGGAFHSNCALTTSTVRGTQCRKCDGPFSGSRTQRSIYTHDVANVSRCPPVVRYTSTVFVPSQQPYTQALET
ncbi:hypothetical protein DIPPA_61946 [Diplonema papillatum]|nr:hypothetical protein DIPPA_61946 [Diplonema papillatum]